MDRSRGLARGCHRIRGHRAIPNAPALVKLAGKHHIWVVVCTNTVLSGLSKSYDTEAITTFGPIPVGEDIEHDQEHDNGDNDFHC